MRVTSLEMTSFYGKCCVSMFVSSCYLVNLPGQTPPLSPSTSLPVALARTHVEAKIFIFGCG